MRPANVDIWESPTTHTTLLRGTVGKKGETRHHIELSMPHYRGKDSLDNFVQSDGSFMYTETKRGNHRALTGIEQFFPRLGGRFKTQKGAHPVAHRIEDFIRAAGDAVAEIPAERRSLEVFA